MQHVRAQLKELADRERDSVARAHHLLDDEDMLFGRAIHIPDRTRLQLVCQAYQWILPSDHPESQARVEDHFPEAGPDSWINASDRVHLLEQLVITPFLIVDLTPPETEVAEGRYDTVDDYFVKTRGVTREQILRLARAQLIGFNLLSFEPGDESRVRQHAESPFIRDILADDRILKWVNSMRLKGFFNRLTDASYQDRVDEGRRALLEAARAFTAQQGAQVADRDIHHYMRRKYFKGRRFRYDDPEAVVQSAKYHYAYVRACGDERAQRALDDRILGGRSAEDFIENVYVLRGLKTAYATRFSASLGAQYRASFGAYESCVRQLNVLSDTLDPHVAQQFVTDQRRGKVRFFSARDQAFIGARLVELIGVHADASAPLRDADDDTTMLRAPVPDAFFSAFIAWHRDNREAVNSLSHLINELSGRRLDDAAAADDLHEPLKDIFERYARLAASYKSVTRSVQDVLTRVARGDHTPTLNILLNVASLLGESGELVGDPDAVKNLAVSGSAMTLPYVKDLGVDKRVFRIKNRNQVALAARFDDYVQLLGRTRT